MTTPSVKGFNEFFSLYTSAIEHTMKVNKAFTSGIEKALHVQAAFVESSLKQFSPLASVKQPGEFVTAQKAVVTAMQEELSATLKKLVAIQTETGNEVKALVEEGFQKFSPEALAKLMPKAA